MRLTHRIGRLILGLLLTTTALPGQELQWQTADGHRFASLKVPSAGQTGFVLLPASGTGVAFTNVLPESRMMENANLMNGSGVALGDYDGDGLCDIYLCSLEGRNVLFRNRGNWKFEDQTASAGVACPGQNSTGAVFADINGDSRLDLLVTALGGPNACFLNVGEGRFTNVTSAAGIASRLGATTMALADVDGNGTLDLYIANYGATSILRSGGALNVSTLPDGRQVVRGRYAQRVRIIDGVIYELGEPDALYLNDGKGRFQQASWTDGRFLDAEGKPLSAAPWDQGLTATFRDLNQDGYPDIYVCNDASTPDRCWINDSTGRFRATSPLALRQTSYFSMGVDFGDLDRDGWDDFLVVDMQGRDRRLRLTQKGTMHRQPKVPGDLLSQLQVRRNTLLQARGDGTFAEIADYAGLESSDWSWSCLFLDVDLDGWEDVLISNGFPHDVDDLDTRERVNAMGRISTDESRRTLLLFPPLDTPNLAFRNQRNLTFQECSREWGFDSRQVSNGMAVGDLDNDGDLDLVVNCMNGPALLYRNESAAARIGVRLRGRSPNTQGIGARIRVTGGPVPQSQEMAAGGRYVSGDDSMRVFAAGQATHFVVEVAWRDGKRSEYRDLRPNRIYEFDEPETVPTRESQKPPSPTTWFEDMSEKLGHVHPEKPFDDFARQPLLPHRLSELGPGIGWLDVDGDGREDLVVGGGSGGVPVLFLNSDQARFAAHPLREASGAGRDSSGVIGWWPGPGRPGILVGSSNYEDGLTNKPGVLRFNWENSGVVGQPGLAPIQGCVGALAAADVDGDGDLDLFAGGRFVSSRYPEGCRSVLLRNDKGELRPDAELAGSIAGLARVTGACFSDMNGDGWPDLVAAEDWGPVRMFINEKGRFSEVTREWGLSELLGWWTGVACGDFNGDGRLDIAAGNWGLNSAYKASPDRPARLFYGDFSGTGGVDLLEAEDAPVLGAVPSRDLLAVAGVLPFVRERFSTHKSYAATTAKQVLGDRFDRARELRATCLASMVFLNRGNRFDAQPLPPIAQWAPVFGLSVADFDGDGREDLFLAQNFSGTRESMPRYDAGQGVVLRGDGTGRFEPVPPTQSGIRIAGDQRGTAVSDWDLDGRIDLVVAQNGGSTKLYRNRGARRGLRIRLTGPPENPAAIGAQARLLFGDSQGPIREIRAGSGYWSMDGSVTVLAAERPPMGVWVRWPGGTVTTNKLEPGLLELKIEAPGRVPTP